jgi:hypothetical protein
LKNTRHYPDWVFYNNPRTICKPQQEKENNRFASVKPSFLSFSPVSHHVKPSVARVGKECARRESYNHIPLAGNGMFRAVASLETAFAVQ